MSLSINNLLVSIGVSYDAQLKAADNLFFAAAVDFTDPTRPQFGGSVGDSTGASATVGKTTSTGFVSVNNPVSGDPVTVRQISTANGPRYQICDNNGKEIKAESISATGATYQNVPRYVVKADGVVYDLLTQSNSSGVGEWRVCDPLATNGNTGLATNPDIKDITLNNYKRAVGRITFKAKEGATIARAQDDLQRTGTIFQLLTRLLESIQDESKGFSSLIR